MLSIWPICPPKQRGAVVLAECECEAPIFGVTSSAYVRFLACTRMRVGVVVGSGALAANGWLWSSSSRCVAQRGVARCGERGRGKSRRVTEKIRGEAASGIARACIDVEHAQRGYLAARTRVRPVSTGVLPSARFFELPCCFDV